MSIKIYCSFYQRSIMSLVYPIFEHDWLMPRAFVYLCPYKDLFLHIRNCPEMVPLICWKVGCKIPKIALIKANEVRRVI